jgi:hypothetical protein
MAKQKGPKFISGTINGLTYYKLNGRYYVRKKSSLSRKRVRRSPAFQRTMEYAGLLGQASQLASAVYRMLPREKQQVERYRALTGQAMQLLKEGLDAAEVKARLSGVKARVSVKAGDCFALRACNDGEGASVTSAVSMVRPAARPVRAPKYVPVFCTKRPVEKRKRSLLRRTGGRHPGYMPASVAIPV